MPLKECPACHNLFDTSTFGAGSLYCSKTCRYTKGGRERLGGPTGRPRNFPVTTTGERELASTFLMEQGWTLRTTRTSNIRVAQRGWFTIKLGFGGGPHERASDCIVWWENSEIMIKSPCKKGVGWKGNGKMTRRIPCHIASCKKCSKTRWFKALLENPTNVSKLLAGDGLAEETCIDESRGDRPPSGGPDGPSAA